jgi:MFS family permease
VVAAITLSAFVWWQRRLAQGDTTPPLLDMALFRRINFTPAVAINFLTGAILIIAMVNVPLVVNVLEGDQVNRAALVSGGLLSAMTGTMALTAWGGGQLAERRGYRLPTLLGLSAAAVGFDLMGWTWALGTPYSQMAWQLALLGVGFGLVTAPVGAAVIDAAPEDQRGIASSLVIVMRLMGMSVGLSALTAWGLRRFDILRTQIDLPPFTDPDYGAALVEGLTRTTVMVLTETFMVSAGVALLAWGVALALKKRD